MQLKHKSKQGKSYGAKKQTHMDRITFQLWIQNSNYT